MENTRFYTAEDIQRILDVKRTKAYAIIKTLNAELEEKGYMTVKGKVSKKYFHQRFFDYDPS